MGDPVKKLESAIEKLSDEQLRSFREWFDRYNAKKWDETIATDSASGKLDSLINKALAEHRAGKTKQL
jgi:hypothetical protein